MNSAKQRIWSGEMNPSMRTVGLSKDGRTNAWSVSLSCGHTFSPVTTMFSHQFVECPKCGKMAFLNYNENRIEEYEE